MTTEFAAPGAAGDGWVAKDAVGHLLIIDVHSLETGIVTSLGERDAIRATIHDIDENHTYEDTLVFPKVLIGSLKARVGQKVLARVDLGVAKPGQNPPYVLHDASNDGQAVKAATDYLKQYQAGAFTAPAPAAQPAAPAETAVDLNDPSVKAALAALAAQQKPGF